jgi:hypothetical protein
VTEQILALLERRRPGFGEWNPDVEEQLRSEALRAIEDLGRQFREVAQDPGYWRRLVDSVQTVALPRYFRMAREHHALEGRHYGIWRGGDLLSRAAYVLVGILVALIIHYTPIPNWLEPLPFVLVLLGPFIPDIQAWWARRGWIKALTALVQDMKAEQEHVEALRPLSEETPVLPPGSSVIASLPRRKERP